MNHDIVKLHARAKYCLPAAFSNSFEVPPFLTTEGWHPESVESFIERLKVDQLVYVVRRAIHVLRYPLHEREHYGLEYLKRTHLWRLWYNGYLEQAADLKKGQIILGTLKKYNYLFFPEEAESNFHWATSFQVSPIDLYINNMLEIGGGLSRSVWRELL